MKFAVAVLCLQLHINSNFVEIFIINIIKNSYIKMRKVSFIRFFLLMSVFTFVCVLQSLGKDIRFIYCSDLHYGIKRTFRGKECESC